MEIIKINDHKFILKGKIDAIIYASEKLLKKIKEDNTLVQLKNMTELPGLFKNPLIMPDAHEGYGFPIGGVAAFDLEDGIVSPGGVGFDINCGVRVLKSNITKDQINKEFAESLFKNIPAGLGENSKIRLSEDELDIAVSIGLKWAEEKGYAYSIDKEYIEENGQMEGIPEYVSKTAKARGRTQLGSLGSGNHFIEVQYVEKILDEDLAKRLGLFKNQVLVMIHSGSRGFGHQVASDYILEIIRNFRDMERDLAYVKLNHPIAERYLGAMRAAVNYAFLNRQLITYFTREVFYEYFKEELQILYDVAHNIAKIEEHFGKKVLVHRKGATRSFWKNHPELKAYKDIGQPVLIPGSMGTASYILIGKEGSKESFGSTCHGAGRVMSRTKAKQQFKAHTIINNLAKEGIIVKSKTKEGVVEEAPEVYKDVDEVIRVVEANQLSKAVVRLRPIIVVKG